MASSHVINSFTGGFRFLSNFYPSVIRWDDKEYKTVEHAFQAAKTHDDAQQEFIRKASTPFQAKQRGRKVDLRDDWESIKDGVMLELLRRKFSDKAMRAELLNTKGAELIEGNTWGDTYWGVCNGRGKNVLGKLLMAVREEIVKHGKPQTDYVQTINASDPANAYPKPVSVRFSVGPDKPARRVVVVGPAKAEKVIADVKKGRPTWRQRK